ncbi:hypothetical protein PM082_019671 [Marasmius tenuissimus]|nr:hypothetical protein PM082_019671 [Marasmius tenuissimus]
MLTYLIDEIGFSVAGDFSRGLKPCPTPVYLFVPPLHVEYISEMCCISHPLSGPLFYWSWDPEGKTVISKDDWKQSGIPELEVEMCLGSHWFPNEYGWVKSHLCSTNYGVNGKQYAQDHGYPELIRGDPHNQRTEVLEDTDSNEDLRDSDENGGLEEDESKPYSSISQHTSSLASLLVNPPVESGITHSGERDGRQETNAGSSVEETRRVRGQHPTVQKSRFEPDLSKPIAQKPAPIGHSMTSVSCMATKRPKQSQGATRIKIYGCNDTSARPAWPQTRGKAIAMVSPRPQPKLVEQKFFGTKSVHTGIGQNHTPARRSVTTVATKQPKPSDQETKILRGDTRDDTPVPPTRLEARGKIVVVSSPKIRPKTGEQKSLGTKAAAANTVQKPTPTRCLSSTQTSGRVVTTPNKPKNQPEQKDRTVVLAKPTPSPSRITRSQTTHANETVKKAWR